MSADRISLLEEYLADDPGDAFTLYALALEYFNAGNYSKAGNFFSVLLSEHPGYLPSYYQFGKLNEQLGKKDKASDIYLKGIELAKQVKDQHTLNELQEVYNSLTGKNDD